jgi:hypothetical protein
MKMDKPLGVILDKTSVHKAKGTHLLLKVWNVEA